MSGCEPIGGTVSVIDRTLPALLTRAEVCALLRVSRPTLDRWVTAGCLRRLEIGPRTVRYLAADVMRLIGDGDVMPRNDCDPAGLRAAERNGRVGVQQAG